MRVLSDPEAREIAAHIWETINLVNLRENVLPTRQRADLILHKASDHVINNVLAAQALGEKARFGRELSERGLRPCPQMRDHFGGGKRPKPAALAEAAPMRQAEQEARGVKIAGSRHIDHFRHLLGLHHMELVFGDDHASRFRARQNRELNLLPRPLQRIVERWERGIAT